ncbi:hypothetical protein QZH41_014526 [Actinostola sp. cb2023]|nr:hypothetical protein QZH41_014526 [Actinostola sp. cb2023]
MAVAVEVFSPVFRTPATASPATRRRRPLALVNNNTPLNNLTLNDDAAEKRQRRLSRVTSVALSSPATPRSTSRLDSERNQTKSGLTNFQLKDLYSNCIKLSTENKINSKNAFGLHLIDYMQDLIKTVKEGDMTNFQVASCTLDASAKIYAGRVDSIHAQVYKMLGGLGRAENNQEGNGDGENVSDEVQGTKQKTRKYHSKPGNTIEANIKNLNVNQFDLEFEVDPLFHKTSAAFDEGGTEGLLLNHLFVRDDMCELLLDSNAITMATRGATTQGQTSQDCSMIDLSELRDAYNNVNFEAHQICPYFTEFEFTNWNRDEQGNTDINNIISQYKNDEHAFDVDAPAEPAARDYSDDDMPDMGEDIEYGRDECESANGGMTAAYSLANATLAFADGEEAQLITSQDPRAVKNTAAATLGSLCLELSDKPSEYSYFKSSMLATWAGPEHWKMKARLSKLAGITTTSSSQDQQPKKKRAKKEAFKVDFEKELDVKQYFSKGRAATTLAKSTLEKLSSVKTTLPEDLHYNADNLFRLFTKPKILVRRQVQQTEVADDGSEWYNYDNPNDAANYCPDLQNGGDDDDNDDDKAIIILCSVMILSLDFGLPVVSRTPQNGRDDDDDDNSGGAINEGAQDMTSAGGINTDMTYDMSSSNSSHGLSFSNESAMDLTMFAGDGLVAQPNKVNKIDISYAKTAKRMDVKKLKTAMWSLLTTQPVDKENVPTDIDSTTQEPALDKDVQDEAKSFKNVYEKLPGLISKHMAKNLSVPIAFVCILHLANEKEHNGLLLKVVNDDD